MGDEKESVVNSNVRTLGHFATNGDEVSPLTGAAHIKAIVEAQSRLLDEQLLAALGRVAEEARSVAQAERDQALAESLDGLATAVTVIEAKRQIAESDFLSLRSAVEQCTQQVEALRSRLANRGASTEAVPLRAPTTTDEANGQWPHNWD